MALPTQSYVWLRLREVAALWVQRETGLANTAVLLDLQNQPRPALPYVGIERRDFPFDWTDDEQIVQVTTAVTVQVTATAAGETVALTLFGLRYAYTLQGGDTTEVARDALLALIAPTLCRIIPAADGHNYASGFQPCTATGAGLDSIVFAGLGVAPVRVVTIERCTVAASTLAYRKEQTGLRRVIMRFNFYWPTRQDGFDLLDEYVEALRSSLQNTDTAIWFVQHGVGFEQPGRIAPQDASAVSGGAMQRRKFFDVLFHANSRIYRADTGLVGVATPTIEITA